MKLKLMKLKRILAELTENLESSDYIQDYNLSIESYDMVKELINQISNEK